MENMGVCSYCDQPFEMADLRPYAFGGKLTCPDCANSTEARQAEMRRRMDEAYRRVRKEAVNSSRIMTVRDEGGYAVVRQLEDLPAGEYTGFLVSDGSEESKN